jgi:hypothetical protein
VYDADPSFAEYGAILQSTVQMKNLHHKPDQENFKKSLAFIRAALAKLESAAHAWNHLQDYRYSRDNSLSLSLCAPAKQVAEDELGTKCMTERSYTSLPFQPFF